jgi:cell fate regulator YaaT (PSP1 superfamily)
MGHCYLIRYGLIGEVGRFYSDGDETYVRGCIVVVKSHRGTELGELLAEVGPETSQAGSRETARVLHAAEQADLELARLASNQRHLRFEACERALREGTWSIELIDVEPLLDDSRTILYYLGPSRLDVVELLAAIKETCGLDAILQPIGRDSPEEGDTSDKLHSCESCGSGLGSRRSRASCGATPSCSDCSVNKLLRSRN